MGFFTKVVTVSVAALAVMMISTWYVTYTVADSDVLRALNGGHAFWEMVEWKLKKIADEPDVRPEKKEEVLAALRKMSVKYRPYFEALLAEPPKKLTQN